MPAPHLAMMNYQLFRLLLLAIVSMAAGLLLGHSAAAAGAGGDHELPLVAIWVELEGSPAARSYLDAAGSSATGSDGIGDGTAASRQSQAMTIARRQVARLASQQDTLVTALRAPAIGAVEIYRLQRLVNGIAVRVAPDRLDAIRRLPGVARVLPLPVTAMANSTSVPFLGVPAVAWDPAGAGVTGAGIDIGIIDTGVDYLHVDFGGSGEAADYAANDPQVISDGFFPSAKVVGGWDFVGDAYDASSSDPAANMPMPDPDPMDCEGHGTHVAGTAAGLGVTNSGTTYAGVYGAGTDFSALSIGPGVAPEARIYALRVFGCSGTTVLVAQALEWAIDPNGDGDFSDRLDVVNLSLAARYGAADDPASKAADLASELGVVVVAAAGNDGDNHFIVGSPAVADRAIAVAATWDDDDQFPAGGVRVESPGDLAGSHQAGGANFGPPLTDLGITAVAAAAEPADACTPLSNGGEISGKIAIVDSTDACTVVSQTRNAQNAGAVGVVLIAEGDELSGVFNDGTGGDITIPPVRIRRTTGETIQQRLMIDAVELTLLRLQLSDAVAVFSSRGPRRWVSAEDSAERSAEGSALKPDVAAPGVIITSARLGNASVGGKGSIIKSGTSMATPHVAGMAALLRQQRPSWSPAEIKAALMTHARDVFLDPESTPPLIGPSRVGSGRIDSSALAGEVLLYGQDEPARVGISFGQVFADIATPTLSLERQAVIDNRGDDALTLDLELRPVFETAGVGWSLPDGATVVVPAGGQVIVSIRLEITAADLRHDHDPALAETVFGFGRFWLTEASAHLLATPDDVPVVGAPAAFRLPIHASARPASAIAASSGSLPVGAVVAGTVALPFAGAGIDSGDQPPSDIRSLSAVLELHHLALAGGPQTDSALDLQAVGVGSDLSAAGSVDAARLVFGVAARGPSSTPSSVRTSVFIDVDDDQTDDFELYTSDFSDFTFPGFVSDAFVSVLRDLDSQAESLQLPLGLLVNDQFSSARFASNTRLLAVRAADLGLTGGNAEISYRVELASASGGGSIADKGQAMRAIPGTRLLATTGPTTRFDVENPGIDAADGLDGWPLHATANGTEIAVDFDVAPFAEDALGVLLLHRHNRPGERLEVVTLIGDRPDLTVAVVDSPDPVVPGGTVELEITVGNDGSQPAPETLISLPLASEVAAFEVGPSSPDCTVDDRLVTCAIGELAAAEAAVVSVFLRLAQVANGSLIEHRVEVSTSAIELDRLDNRALVSTLAFEVPLFADGFETGDTTSWSSAQD